MKKQVIRMFSVVFSLSLILSSFSLANAQTASPNTECAPEDCLFVVNYSSDEELSELIAAIEENNRIAHAKWEEALAK